MFRMYRRQNRLLRRIITLTEQGEFDWREDDYQTGVYGATSMSMSISVSSGSVFIYNITPTGETRLHIFRLAPWSLVNRLNRVIRKMNPSSTQSDTLSAVEQLMGIEDN